MSRKSHLVVGTGHGARFVVQLLDHLYRDEAQVVIATRHRGNAGQLLSEFPALKVADINAIHGSFQAVWLAVPDGQIAMYAHRLAVEADEWIHISGATPLDALASHAAQGVVVWPVISLASPYRLEEVPIVLETQAFSQIAERIREKLPKSVYMPYHNRLSLHAAAVVSNNFVHHLHALLEDEMQRKHIDREILIPILMQTHARLLEGNLKHSQTGPARRGDDETIEKHLQLIESEHLSELYKFLSQSIQTYYATKL